MQTRQTWQRSILADHWNVTLRRVYADWLEDNNDYTEATKVRAIAAEVERLAKEETANRNLKALLTQYTSYPADEVYTMTDAVNGTGYDAKVARGLYERIRGLKLVIVSSRAPTLSGLEYGGHQILHYRKAAKRRSVQERYVSLKSK